MQEREPLSRTPFQFTLHTQINVGPGVSERLPETLQDLGLRRVALVVDAGVVSTQTFRAVRDKLTGSVEIVHELINDVSEPDYDYLDHCRDRLALQPVAAMVGFGGGARWT